MTFRIYYGDGSTHEGDPFAAKPNDVICVVVPSNDPPGFKVWHSRDHFYWHKDMGWVPADTWGYNDYALNYIGAKNALFGRNVRDDVYWRIVDRAHKEGLG